MKLSNNIHELLKRKNQIAVLIDPEKTHTRESLMALVEKAEFAGINFFFIGGSTVTRDEFDQCVDNLVELTQLPLIIFPGSSNQLSNKADAILYLSLISGRNPDFLIGHHVSSAHELYDMDIEVIPTAYILIDGGSSSSVAYVSQTTPIPPSKESIIMNTAKAGILQGKKLLYLDAGSGAKNPVPTDVIHKLAALKQSLIIGGGIKELYQIKEMHAAGANVVVIGNKIEENIDFLLDIKSYKREVLC